MTVITRDTFGMAMKATYGEFGDKKLFIYKDPKTDDGNLKKSHKGCCQVWKYFDDAPYVCNDEFVGQVHNHETMLKTVFKDSALIKVDTFMDIRRRMYD
jgi:nicotinamide phosphoribosyltransferase